jgi:hypothetical protein
MAFINPDDHGGSVGLTAPSSIQNITTAQNIVISPAGLTEVPVPGGGFVTNAVMTQEGSDLILESPDGITLVIEGYFSGDAPPNLVSDGKVLTPALVKSFIQASTDYAEDKVALNDVTPIGQAHEVSGNAFVTHQDGTRQQIVKGTAIYEGDIVETDAKGAVNIKFVDESSFAVSNNAKMAIDEFVYDSTTHGGENNFSMLRGLFVYTSGLVGREDPDDVKIETPVGSIGIRGTIITGSLPGEGSTEPAKISVVEGAIVIEDRNGQSITLSQQFETVQIDASGMKNIGVMPGAEMTQTFNVLRTVAPTLFSAVEEAQQEAAREQQSIPTEAAPVGDKTTPTTEAPAQENPSVEPQPAPDVIQLNLMPELLNPDMMDKALADSSNTTTVRNSPLINLTSLGAVSYASADILPPPSAPALAPVPTSPTLEVTPVAPVTPPPTTPGPTQPNQAPFTSITNYSVLEQGGHNGGSHSFEIRHFFSDADGDTLTFTPTIAMDPNNLITSFDIDANGILTFSAQNTVPGPINNVAFSVIASDGQASSTPVVFSLNIYQLTLTLDGLDNTQSLTTTNNVVAMLDGNDYATISSVGNIVFGGNGEDTLSILSGSSSNKIFGEAGDDQLSIMGGTANLASGGLGNDTITVSMAAAGDTYSVFGGDGNDTITLGNANAVNSLYNGTSLIDGGSGFDTLVLGSGVSINLSLVDGDSLKLIDKIRLASTGAATITLDIQNIFGFGEDGRSLYLDVDGNDIVNITNTTGNTAFTQRAGTVTDADGETYNIFSNGITTLYLSADANMANVTGL